MKKTIKSRRPVRSSTATKTTEARRTPKKTAVRKTASKTTLSQTASSATRAAAQQHHVVLALSDPLETTFNTLQEHLAPAVDFTVQPTLETALEEAGGTVIIPVRAPIEALARDMSTGATPSEALARWTKATDALLKACRSKRRRILLLDAAALLQGTPDSLEALTARLKVTCDVTVPEGQTDMPPPIYWSLAAGTLAADPAARGLADMLEALITGPIAPQWPDMDTLLDAWNDIAAQRRETDEIRADLARAEAIGAKMTKLQDDTDLLRENLALMLTELERKSEAIVSLEADRAKLQDALADFHLQKAEIVALKTQSDELVQRIAVLETDKEADEAHKQKLKTNAEGLRAEIEKVYASKSWRITEPLRRARSILPVAGRS